MIEERYSASPTRYDNAQFNRCGQSGILLPKISLGLWHNFGELDNYSTCRDMLKYAFDHGVTHFDLANNYGPPFGSAEKTFGRILKQDFEPYRHELFISTKAGYSMWPGPYGDFGSRKYLISSLDMSLKHMGLDYVDVFYHHRPDPDTPLEETMGALDHIVRSGKALYAGISNYPAEMANQAAEILKSLGTPCLIHQAKYSMLERSVEDELLNVVEDQGMGMIAFSPLAQGLLTDRYLNDIPKDSRVIKSDFLQEKTVQETMPMIKSLNDIAKSRNQSLAQMAISWLLKDKRVTSVLVGASSVSQLKKNLGSLDNLVFSNNELNLIDQILKNQ